jgi:hypothetical protein
MPKFFRDRFLTDGVRLEALQSDKPPGFSGIEGIEVEGGHQMAFLL